MRIRGFTLMEMLVALGIFAAIGVISAQLLRQTIDVSDAVINRGDRLVEIQRAMNVISRDFRQVVKRTVRDEFGDATYPFELDNFGVLKFTKAGWSNIMNRPRSTLQRVEYYFETGSLIRRYWPVLDRTEVSEPFEQVLLTDVESFEFAILDGQGIDQTVWPPLMDVMEGSESNPLAFQVTMVVPPFAEISRVWLILQMPEIVDPQEVGGRGGRGGPPISVPIVQ